MSVGILLAMFGETRMVVALSCMLVCDEAFGTLGGWGLREDMYTVVGNPEGMLSVACG